MAQYASIPQPTLNQRNVAANASSKAHIDPATATPIGQLPCYVEQPQCTPNCDTLLSKNCCPQVFCDWFTNLDVVSVKLIATALIAVILGAAGPGLGSLASSYAFQTLSEVPLDPSNPYYDPSYVPKGVQNATFGFVASLLNIGNISWTSIFGGAVWFALTAVLVVLAWQDLVVCGCGDTWTYIQAALLVAAAWAVSGIAQLFAVPVPDECSCTTTFYWTLTVGVIGLILLFGNFLRVFIGIKDRKQCCPLPSCQTTLGAVLVLLGLGYGTGSVAEIARQYLTIAYRDSTGNTNWDFVLFLQTFAPAAALVGLSLGAFEVLALECCQYLKPCSLLPLLIGAVGPDALNQVLLNGTSQTWDGFRMPVFWYFQGFSQFHLAATLAFFGVVMSSFQAVIPAITSLAGVALIGYGTRSAALGYITRIQNAELTTVAVGLVAFLFAFTCYSTCFYDGSACGGDIPCVDLTSFWQRLSSKVSSISGQLESVIYTKSGLQQNQATASSTFCLELVVPLAAGWIFAYGVQLAFNSAIINIDTSVGDDPQWAIFTIGVIGAVGIVAIGSAAYQVILSQSASTGPIQPYAQIKAIDEKQGQQAAVPPPTPVPSYGCSLETAFVQVLLSLVAGGYVQLWAVFASYTGWTSWDLLLSLSVWGIVAVGALVLPVVGLACCGLNALYAALGPALTAFAVGRAIANIIRTVNLRFDFSASQSIMSLAGPTFGALFGLALIVSVVPQGILWISPAGCSCPSYAWIAAAIGSTGFGLSHVAEIFAGYIADIVALGWSNGNVNSNSGAEYWQVAFAIAPGLSLFAGAIVTLALVYQSLLPYVCCDLGTAVASLLFPAAINGSLADILRGKVNSGQFQSIDSAVQVFTASAAAVFVFVLAIILIHFSYNGVCQTPLLCRWPLYLITLVALIWVGSSSDFFNVNIFGAVVGAGGHGWETSYFWGTLAPGHRFLFTWAAAAPAKGYPLGVQFLAYGVFGLITVAVLVAAYLVRIPTISTLAAAVAFLGLAFAPTTLTEAITSSLFSSGSKGVQTILDVSPFFFLALLPIVGVFYVAYIVSLACTDPFGKAAGQYINQAYARLRR